MGRGGGGRGGEKGRCMRFLHCRSLHACMHASPISERNTWSEKICTLTLFRKKRSQILPTRSYSTQVETTSSHNTDPKPSSYFRALVSKTSETHERRPQNTRRRVLPASRLAYFMSTPARLRSASLGLRSDASEILQEPARIF